MPRYPELYPLSKADLKEINRVRNNDQYIKDGSYPTFDAYCIGEWQRSANTINKRLKREGLASKRTQKIQKKRDEAGRSAEWIRAKYAVLKGSSHAPESVSPSVSPNSAGVSPLPSRNISNSRTQKREGMSNEEMKKINKGTIRTQNSEPPESNEPELPSDPSGGATKTQAQLDAEFDRLWNA